jgi:DNA-binding NarL/FixJ family response regulator
MDQNSNKLRILIADDHELARGGIRMLIRQQPGWEVCGEAADGRKAVALAEKLLPDVIVMDLGMRELNGLDATRQIKRSLPQTEVVIFTGEGEGALIQEAFAAGARSYISKTDIGQHLVAAIRAVSEHRHYLTSPVSEVLLARYLQGASTAGPEPAGDLTPREREIIQLVCEAKSNKQVGDLLGISVKTVEAHRSALMRKLNLESFPDLMRYAIRNKIVAL